MNTKEKNVEEVMQIITTVYEAGRKDMAKELKKRVRKIKVRDPLTGKRYTITVETPEFNGNIIVKWSKGKTKNITW